MSDQTVNQRQCGVEGCPEKRRAKGYCPKHYQRWKVHGSPHIVFQKQRCKNEIGLGKTAFIRNGVGVVLLASGEEALVDPEDLPLVANFSWQFGRGYAQSKNGKVSRLMHRLILNAPDGVKVDHANLNRLDNRRCNLRLATDSLNGANKIHPIGRSGYKGVGRAKSKPWVAHISVNKRYIHLGHFLTKEEAARAYDRAAMHYFGEFARLNFPA